MSVNYVGSSGIGGSSNCECGSRLPIWQGGTLHQNQCPNNVMSAPARNNGIVHPLLEVQTCLHSLLERVPAEEIPTERLAWNQFVSGGCCPGASRQA